MPFAVQGAGGALSAGLARQVFERCGAPLVKYVIEKQGKASCFCYGQTGSGKTHTMMGNPSQVPWPGPAAGAAAGPRGLVDAGGSGRGGGRRFPPAGGPLRRLATTREELQASGRACACVSVCVEVFGPGADGCGVA